MTKKQIEKKAKEIGIKYQNPCHGVGDCEFEARQAAIEMADWLLGEIAEGLSKLKEGGEKK